MEYFFKRNAALGMLILKGKLNFSRAPVIPVFLRNSSGGITPKDLPKGQEPQDSAKIKWVKMSKYEIFHSVLLKKQYNLINPNFEQLEIEMKGSIRFLNNEVFSTMLMKYFLENNHYDLAKKYINYLKDLSTPNPMIIAYYIEICGLNNQENELFKYLEDIPKDFYLNRTIIPHIITGMLNTSRWKETLPILQLWNSQKTKTTLQNYVATTAFKNNDIGIGTKIVEEIKGKLYEITLQKWLEAISNLDNEFKIQALRTFLDTSKDRKTNFDLETIEKLKEFFERYFARQCKIVEMHVSEKFCTSCGQELETLEITDEEFKLLQAKMDEILLKGSSVYFNSHPKEIARFKTFLRNAKPYHLVVDGLNLAYQTNRASNMPLKVLDGLKFIIQKRKYTSLLLLGRKHMLKWPKDIMNKIQNESQIFLTDNISEDDPFLLYSTIAGGRNTKFASLDLMRNHLYKFHKDPTIQTLFNKWNKTHHVTLDARNKPFLLIEPAGIDVCCQGNLEDGIHIPCMLEDPYHNLSQKWLCVRKK